MDTSPQQKAGEKCGLSSPKSQNTYRQCYQAGNPNDRPALVNSQDYENQTYHQTYDWISAHAEFPSRMTARISGLAETSSPDGPGRFSGAGPSKGSRKNNFTFFCWPAGLSSALATCEIGMEKLHNSIKDKSAYGPASRSPRGAAACQAGASRKEGLDAVVLTYQEGNRLRNYINGQGYGYRPGGISRRAGSSWWADWMIGGSLPGRLDQSSPCMNNRITHQNISAVPTYRSWG